MPEKLFGLWVAEDLTKSFRLGCNDEGELRVTVWRGLGEEVHVADRVACWHAPDPEKATDGHARARLGYVQVELGETNLGTTYDLMVGWPNPAGEGYQWIAAPPDADVDDLRIFPEGGASFYEAVLGRWDDAVEEMNEAEQAWIEPLSTYRRATAEQLVAHEG